MSKEYQVTIGYKAIIEVIVKADNEEQAKADAMERFTKRERNRWFTTKDIGLGEDSYAAHGVLDLDNTWNAL